MKKMSKKSKKLPLEVRRGEGKRTDESIEIFNVPLFGTHKSQVLDKICLQRKEMLHVATVNPEYIMEARHNHKFRNILAHSLTVADGFGVVWALRLLSVAQGKQVERITGGELVEEMLVLANKRQEKVFLLGAAEGVAEAAAHKMATKYPGAEIAWYSGAQTVKLEKSEEASMTIAKINGFEPDYLLVAYGSPWQDIWIEDNRAYLRARVAIGIGGVLDEWAGTVKKCPEAIDRAGLKWLWRVVHEPWRWRRILKVFQFGGLVLYHKLID